LPFGGLFYRPVNDSLLEGGDAMALAIMAIACFLQAVSTAVGLAGWLAGWLAGKPEEKTETAKS
jgi:hypothetical protein